MKIPRNFLFKLPIVLCTLLLTTAFAVWATAPRTDFDRVTAAVLSQDAFAELAAE